MSDLNSLPKTTESQAVKSKELRGDLKAEDSWSCVGEASDVVADVSYIFLEPLEEQFFMEAQAQQQQQLREHKHAQSAISGICFHSSGNPASLMENVAFCSPCLEFQRASMQQRRKAAQPGTYLLGLLVTVVDEVAGDFVFGPCDSDDIPRGLATVSAIDKLDSVKLLSDSCQKRWVTFLEPWHAAGWDATSLSDFANTLRPLCYRDDIDQAYIRNVSRDYLQKYIADLFTKQGFAMVDRYDAEDFLDIVHRLYSQHDAVLLLAQDAASRCDKQTSGDHHAENVV